MSAKKSRSAIPRKNNSSADVVMTPDYLAREIVEYFQPQGYTLDPCAGDGAFVGALCRVSAIEITVSHMEINSAAKLFNGRSFFELPPQRSVDWIISNPPYSILRPWLQHSYKVADNIVYLVQQPRPFFKAIMEDAERAGFGIKEIYRVPTPREWRKVMSPFGGGYCAAHWQRGWDHRRHGTLFSGSNSEVKS